MQLQCQGLKLLTNSSHQHLQSWSDDCWALAGVDDFTCNWLGTERWINALPWNGSAGWAATADRPWFLSSKGDVLAGSARNHGPLTFVKVAHAGHLVPMDQPEAAHDLLMRFLRGTGFEIVTAQAQAQTQDLLSESRASLHVSSTA